MSLIDRDGWPGSLVNASKFSQTVATSLPSQTSYPIPRKMSSISRVIWVSRCRRPRSTGVPGIVTSTPLPASSLEGEPLQRRHALLDRRLELRANAVQQHAALAVAHAAQRLRELGLAPEEAHACLVELRVAERGADRGDCFLLVRLPVHGGDTIQGSSFESRVRVETAPGRAEGASARRGPSTGAA